jgi:hypothetical protein
VNFNLKQLKPWIRRKKSDVENTRRQGRTHEGSLKRNAARPKKVASRRRKFLLQTFVRLFFISCHSAQQLKLQRNASSSWDPLAASTPSASSRINILLHLLKGDKCFAVFSQRCLTQAGSRPFLKKCWQTREIHGKKKNLKSAYFERYEWLLAMLDIAWDDGLPNFKQRCHIR